MFDVRFNPYNPNGFTTYIMNSSESVDKIIATFENAIKSGMDPQDALSYAVKVNNIQESDLTIADKNRINRKVEEIYRAYTGE